LRFGRSADRTRISGVLLALGSLLLLATLLMPWYSISATARNDCTNYTAWFYPLGVAADGAGSYCPSSGPASTGYSSAGLPMTGELYLAVFALTVGACVAACASAVAVVRPRVRILQRPLLVVMLAAVVLAGVGPVLVTLEQPATICSDIGFVGTPLGITATHEHPFNQTGVIPPRCQGWVFWSDNGYGWSWNGGNGPWSSFAGGVQDGGAALNWAPSLGWYLSIVSTGILVTGVCAALVPGSIGGSDLRAPRGRR
jgi:hypothetical protein